MSEKSIRFQVARLIAENDSIAESYLYFPDLKTDEDFEELFEEKPFYNDEEPAESEYLTLATKIIEVVRNVQAKTTGDAETGQKPH